MHTEVGPELKHSGPGSSDTASGHKMDGVLLRAGAAGFSLHSGLPRCLSIAAWSQILAPAHYAVFTVSLLLESGD